MPATFKIIHRSRVFYLAAAAFVISTGLLWRSGYLPLSPFLFKYGGDALWALLIFIGFGFIFPRTAIWRIALCALAAAWSIEFLQLYHAPWIDEIRATRLGQLILGSTFNAPDLLAYAVGILLGGFAEFVIVRASPIGSRPKA